MLRHQISVLLLIGCCIGDSEVSYRALPRNATVACDPDTQPYVLRAATDWFTTLHYPGHYENDAYCTWEIVAQPGQVGTT